MQLTHRLIVAGLPAAALSTPAAAQTLDLTLTIPRMTVAEYHAPYVAVYLEAANGQPAKTLSIWYDYDNRENGGKKWLTDVRQWWRASGRSLALPANGVSGATRAAGTQKLSFTAGTGQLPRLAPGQYALVIEAAREVGGREVLRLPFAWPPKPGQKVALSGKSELGAVTLSFR